MREKAYPYKHFLFIKRNFHVDEKKMAGLGEPLPKPAELHASAEENST